MPRSQNPDWIDWKKSEAKKLILKDLEEGVLSLEVTEVSAEEAWEVYRHMPEFVSDGVVFSQFKERLRDHRRQVKKLKISSARERQALDHDRQLYPRQHYNHRGEPVFDLHPAKMLLRDDVKNKRHTNMVPSVFQTTHLEYMVFKRNKFKHRIYQEVRRQKFIAYLEAKRAGTVGQQQED